MSVYFCSGSLNKYLLSVNKPSRVGDLQVSPKDIHVCAWVACSTLGTAVRGMHGEHQYYGAGHSNPTLADPSSVHAQLQSQYLLCRPAQAEPGASWMPACQPRPSPRVPQARWGWAGPGNLSQLLCPVSGKPRTGTLPMETACPCTCLWHFLEEPWRPNPHLQLSMPKATSQASLALSPTVRCVPQSQNQSHPKQSP